MKPIILLIFSFTSLSLHAQNLIGQTPKQVKKYMLNFMNSNQYTKFTVEKKSTDIIFKLREDTLADVDYSFEFDPKGRCFASGTFAECLQCVENALNAALSYKKYGWVKLNDSTWLSSYRHCLQMVLKKNEGEPAVHTLDIRKMLWSRSWYNDKLAGKN